MSGIVDSYDYLFKWFWCLQNGNRFLLLFCFLQNWSLILLFFIFQKNCSLSEKKFLVFEAANILRRSNVSRGVPEIKGGQVTVSNISESYSVHDFFADSSTASILSLTEKRLLTEDKVSVNASLVNNSSVIWKLFRKRLVFSSNSCIHLLLDKSKLGLLPTAREKCASHNKDFY